MVPGLGQGIYELSDAARLLRVDARNARRWLAGYRYCHAGEERHGEPLWQTDLESLEGRVGLSFRDLVQLRIVRDLLAGFGLRTIRRALDHAQELLGSSHPFATARFRTDGRRIFLEIVDQNEEPQAYDLLHRQYGFHKIIEPSFKELEFDRDQARRWWPISKQKLVVLDPERAFGQPITANSGIPTATLAHAVEAEGSVISVARWFDIDPREVRDALAFERGFQELQRAA